MVCSTVPYGSNEVVWLYMNTVLLKGGGVALYKDEVSLYEYGVTHYKDGVAHYVNVVAPIGR